MSKKTEPDRITLTFDLLDLPTAQHRAGLAGMILQVESMKSRKLDRKRIPELSGPTATTVGVTFTRDSLQGVLDDLYEARIVEASSGSKWPGAKLKREESIDQVDRLSGKVKTVKRFIYDMVQPQAPCLTTHLNPPEDSPWLKLWQTMTWAIPRGINTTRAPYNRRAEGVPCAEGPAAWELMLADQDLRVNGRFKTDPISGALMLGAQAVNAEAIPFAGRVDQNLLLHFWQVVVLTFVPQVVTKKDAKIEPWGYVLAIPDVADLREFCRALPEILSGLPPERRGFLPAAALIDLPAQANLEVLRKLKADHETAGHESAVARAIHREPGPPAGPGDAQALATGKAMREGWGESIRAVESFHMLKQGNNIKMLSFARVTDRPGLVGKYERIATTFRNPLFRASLMRSLIRGGPWHGGMVELFAEYPSPFFIEGDDTPRYLPRFGRDVRDQFRAFYKDLYDMSFEGMNEDERLQHLGLVLQRLVNKYVEGRAEAKTRKKVKDFPKAMTAGKERRIYPNDFREAQQRVCSDAFLAMRSRHDQDFVEFFAGSICSVAQFLPRDDYQFLIRTLMTKPDPDPVVRKGLSWEDVKAIAMIAVSATSFNVRPRDTEDQGSPS